MKIPESIKVGGHTYYIEYSRDLIRDDGRLGQVTWQMMRIQLEENQSESSLAATFLHEVLHIVDKHYNAKRNEEADIDRLSEGLYQVLSDMGITFER